MFAFHDGFDPFFHGCHDAHVEHSGGVSQDDVGAAADDDDVAGLGEIADHLGGGINENLVVDALNPRGGFAGQFKIGFR